ELDRLSDTPDLFGTDLGAYLNLRAITSLLRNNAGPTPVTQAQARMWQLALHMEEGAAERTARALEQARQQLRDALDRQAKGEPARTATGAHAAGAAQCPAGARQPAKGGAAPARPPGNECAAGHGAARRRSARPYAGSQQRTAAAGPRAARHSASTEAPQRLG